jgi:hypothetical protein
MRFLALPSGWNVNLETILYTRAAWVESREVIAVRFVSQHSDVVLAGKGDAEVLSKYLRNVPMESHQVNPLLDAVGGGAQSLASHDQALASADENSGSS